METKTIKALYTLSNGEGVIFISKGDYYSLQNDGMHNYIIDNTGGKMTINSETLRTKFEW